MFYNASFRIVWYSLVIRKWKTADSSIKEACRIRVFLYGTKIEHPVVLAVSSFQKSFGIFSAISVYAFKTRRWIAHDDNLISEIYEVCS